MKNSLNAETRRIITEITLTHYANTSTRALFGQNKVVGTLVSRFASTAQKSNQTRVACNVMFSTALLVATVLFDGVA